MSNSVYPLRNFIIPSGYSLPVISTDVYNNATIDGLYKYFSLCYAQMESSYVQSFKKGTNKEQKCKAKYLLMSLYTLRNWYSGGFNFNGALTYNPAYSTSFYWEVAPTDTFTTNPLILNVSHGNSISDFVNNLNLVLPIGYLASAILSNTEIRIQTVNPPQQYLYAINMHGSTVTGTGTQDIDYWACASYDAIQNIIENCIKICGEVNCQTLAALETDNVYTPVGIMKALPIPGITNYQPDIYFN